MARTVLELDARASVLDAAEKVASAPPGDELVLAAAASAPVFRSVVFIEVLRAQAAPRRLSVVTTDPRARAIASSVHVPAYASIAALERHQLDPTERIEPARRSAMGGPRTSNAAGRLPIRRVAAIAGSLGLALAIVAAVVLPEATVTVSPEGRPLGPVELVVKAGAGGDVPLTPVNAAVTAKVTGTASGVRIEEVAAKGSVQLENKTTDDVRVPKGSIFKTVDGRSFLSTADMNLPRSVIIPPFTLVVGRQSVPVQAAIAGTGGNIPAGRITVGPDPSRYTVSNPEATSGGEAKRIPVVKLEDYDAAVKRGPDALRGAAEDQLARWMREPRAGQQVVPQVLVRQTAIAPANVDVVGKETPSFDLTVSGIATAYVVPDSEPKRAAVVKLRDAVSSGNDVDERSAVIDIKSVRISESPDVTWSITARASQSKHVVPQRVGRLLAGHAVRDAQPILSGEGLRLVRIDWIPAWWPLLPVLDGRIRVDVEIPPVTTIP